MWLWLPVASLLVAAAALVWLLETDSGLQWAYAQLRARVPGALETQSLEGKLAGPVRVTGLVYRSDAVDVKIERAQLDWAPAALLLGRVQIEALTVDGIDVAIHETGKPRTSRGFVLPLNVGLSSLRLAGLRIERPGHAPYVVHSVQAAGFLGQQLVRVGRLKIEAMNFGVDAAGTLALRGDGHERLHVQWHAAPSATLSIRGSGDIEGSLPHLVLTQRLTEPIAATVHAQILEPFADLQWRVDAELPEFDLRHAGFGNRELRVSATVDASGGLTRYTANGKLRAETPDFPPIAGSYMLHGTTSGDEVVIDQLALRVPDTDIGLTAHGRWQPHAAAWAANATWQNLRWPLGGTVVLASPRGMLDVAGDYARYDLRLDFATAATGFPSAQWRAAGHGDQRRLAFDKIAVDTLGSTVTATASVAWSPRLRWNAALQARALDPAVAWPDWPGSLGLDATFSGDASELRGNVQSLRGKLRGQTLAVNASVVRRHNDYPEFALNVTAGEAHARVSGALDSQWNVDWGVRVPDVAALWPQAAGALSGTGRIGGSRARPRVDAQLSATGLAYGQNRIDQASVDAAIDLSDRTRSHAALVFTGGGLFNRPFERIAVTLDGSRTDHAISIDAQAAPLRFQAALRGTYADDTWSAVLQTSTLGLGSETWSLAGSPRLVIGKNRIALDQTCWRGDATRLCATAQRDPDARSTLGIVAERLPIGPLAAALPGAPDWRGTLDANADLQFDAGRLVHADARWSLGPGDVTLVGATRASLSYAAAGGRLTVDDNGLRARAEIALGGGDGGNAELALPQFQSAAAAERQPIEGRLSFTMHDLAPLAAVFPQLEALSGALKMNFQAGGTLADPRVRGEATLAGAAARIPAVGIRVHDATLAASADGGDTLRLQGAAQSGPGRLALSGRVLFPGKSAWRAELHITGDRFQAADLREAGVFVSPDLQATLTPGTVDVSGTVRLPQARFTRPEPKSNVVTPSSDVVIVNAPQGASTAQSRWTITARIRVILGDDVNFSGFGLHAKLAGDVALTETPEQPTTARGQVRVVKGQYEAYGQKLDVERGRLIFVGGPVTNPGIDARAVRKIEQAGGAGRITAGVQVAGTLQAPQLTLFSDPAMSQTDTLSYLLLGRPAEGASAAEGRSLAAAALALRITGGEGLAQRIASTFGIQEIAIGTVGTPGTTGAAAATGTAGTTDATGATGESAALVLGRQLSPRLYINYSIGLFTPANVLHLKYKLGKHWSLEAQSGVRAGGDLIYTIEK